MKSILGLALIGLILCQTARCSTRARQPASEEESQGNEGVAHSCPPCNETSCAFATCPLVAKYECIAGVNSRGCSPHAATWENNIQCNACCDVAACEIHCPPCTKQCDPETCPAKDPFYCEEGTDAGGCGTQSSFDGTRGCTKCCNFLHCFSNRTTPGPGHTNQPPAPPTQDCPSCNVSRCHPTPPCGRGEPFFCVTTGGCKNSSWAGVAGCDECCDLSPICYPPRPPSPWDGVPNSTNCSLSPEGPYLAPNPAKTKYGGMDVGKYGCREHITDQSDCCGVTPRFNWILSTCHKNQSKHESMACLHNYSNTSAMDLYYVSAYQWNGTHWTKDKESSVKADSENGEKYVDFEKLNMRVGGGYRQDWDLKYSPTTANSGTQGLGPPGMLFVLSAAHFAWSAFYLLNQLTLNRGPGGEIVRINCWQFGSGELDFIESPFWADVVIPPDRLYTTVTADAGRCFPVQKNVPQTFHESCTDEYCCEMCSCPNGTLCFGKEKNIGFQAMGCIPEANRSQIPKSTKIFKVDNDDLGCGKRFGGVSGGSTSNAFFNQANINGTGEYIYAAVVDFLGVKVYRWPTHKSGSEAEQEEEANPSWPGIGKFGSADVLATRQPLNLHEFQHNPPCDDAKKPCIIYEPSCVGDCPVVSAAGNFGPDELAGGYSAEAARDGLNWWDLFQKTADDPYLDIDSLPKWTHVPTFTPPLPFYCNKSCGPELCHELTRCPFKSPFECTTGDGAGGCSNESTFWPLSQHCSGCCDVTYCDIPCTACNASICDASPAFCPVNLDPYLCTSGGSVRGCSADASYWPRQAGCDSCCDLRDCAPSSPPRSPKNDASDSLSTTPNPGIVTLEAESPTTDPPMGMSKTQPTQPPPQNTLSTPIVCTIVLATFALLVAIRRRKSK